MSRETNYSPFLTARKPYKYKYAKCNEYSIYLKCKQIRFALTDFSMLVKYRYGSDIGKTSEA